VGKEREGPGLLFGGAEEKLARQMQERRGSATRKDRFSNNTV